MDSIVHEIAADVYRISMFHPEYGIQFNQFLLKDDEPFLMHTGLKKMFPATLDAGASILEPSRLRWIGFSHFESDECGALNEWLKVAACAEALCSVVGAIVMANDFADRPARALADGEMLSTGLHRLQFLATPHVPHGWDAGLFFDVIESTLFCSDLVFHPGNPEPLAGAQVLERAQEAIVQNLTGPLTNDMPYTPQTGATLARLAALKPRTLAVMHGSSVNEDCGSAVAGLARFIEATLGAHSVS